MPEVKPKEDFLFIFLIKGKHLRLVSIAVNWIGFSRKTDYLEILQWPKYYYFFLTTKHLIESPAFQFACT